MNNQYQHLFTPIQIGNTTIKNRIFMPPLSTNLADKGYVTDALVKHYEARAKGGVGLIVTEVTTVEPTYTYLPGDMSIYDDSYIPGWKKLVDAVHRYDTKILSQLFHPAYMAFPIPGTPQLIAPSNVGPYYAKSAPREVTKEELKVLVKQFGEAALRFKKAGGDQCNISKGNMIICVKFQKQQRCKIRCYGLGDKAHITGNFCLMIAIFLYSIHFLFPVPNIFNNFMFNRKMFIKMLPQKKSVFGGAVISILSPSMRISLSFIHLKIIRIPLFFFYLII